MISILCSILNWNSADDTIDCLKSLESLALPPATSLTISVIDNGSTQENWQKLASTDHAANVFFTRLPSNIGFTGGHNISIQKALVENFDYIWLLNNDTQVFQDTLKALLSQIEQDATCGVISPVIKQMDSEKYDFIGAQHNWSQLSSDKFTNVEEYQRAEQSNPSNIWISGTAALYRCDVLRSVGKLDDALFAYYDDNDICARISKAGWSCKLALNALVRHEAPTPSDRPIHYHYLMARNELLFWYKNTPKPHRSFIKLRTAERLFLRSLKLDKQGKASSANGVLTGIMDGLLGKGGGVPKKMKTPYLMRFALFMLTPRLSKYLS